MKQVIISVNSYTTKWKWCSFRPPVSHSFRIITGNWTIQKPLDFWRLMFSPKLKQQPLTTRYSQMLSHQITLIWKEFKNFSKSWTFPIKCILQYTIKTFVTAVQMFATIQCSSTFTLKHIMVSCSKNRVTNRRSKNTTHQTEIPEDVTVKVPKSPKGKQA